MNLLDLTDDFPYIDPTVEHVGVSKLRTLNATKLREADKTLVIQDNDTPVAVLLAYDKFVSIQQQMLSLLATVEVLSDEDEMSLLTAGLRSAAAGQTRSLEEIERSLEQELGSEEMNVA